MSLPTSYNTSKEYLSNCLDFLKTFSWLYKYQNTNIIAKRVLTNFPYEWVLYFKNISYNNLKRLLEGETEEDCPANLKSLIKKIIKLKPNNNVRYSQTCKPNLVHNSGLSRKKLHEIISLVPLIDEVCRQNSVNIVVDVGAGLGYLSHLLNDKYGHTVLGIECSSKYIALAYKNQLKFYPNLKGRVEFAQHFIDENSGEEIKSLLDKYFPNIPEKTVCIAGLHACADLSITILDLFSKLEFVKCLVIMPCCYHRIKKESTAEERGYFKNFPASVLLKSLFKDFKAEEFIAEPFLRLACQQSMRAFKNMTDQEHERHSRSCMHRAVLQEVVMLENCEVKRLKRKSGRSHHPNVEKDFRAYLKNLKHTHQIEYNDNEPGDKLNVNDERFQQKMLEKWNQHKNDCHLVEILTGFQASIQSICENIVLLDRVEFLKEKGFKCRAQKVTDDGVSPRCYALIAFKD